MIGKLGAGLALLAAPVSLAAAPKAKEFARPTYAGAYEPQGVDERGIWAEIDESERAVRDSPIIVRNEQLESYIRSVLCKTVGFDRCAAARIYILKDSSFNASMEPNGLMRVHTGLLARLHSEAELAAILGHEFAHFELRHSLQRYRKQRTGSDFAAWIALAGAATNRGTSDIQTNIFASLRAFSRENETEADLLSSAYVRSSPYKLVDAQVWGRIVAENDALRTERGQRKIRRYSPGLFDTHPTPLQRIAYLSKLDAETEGEGDDGVEAYRQATAPVLAELFAGLIKSNEFGGTDYVIRSRGDAMGWDGQLLTIRAELYRLRGNPRDIVTAREFFAKAVTYPDAPAEGWRGLGLTALRLGEVEPGRTALIEYLKRAPEAKDAAAMKLLLEN